SPYEEADVKLVELAYDSIGFTGINSSKGGWTSFSFAPYTISFTQSYWLARIYGGKSGGERIKNLMVAIDEFITLLNDQTLLEYHKNVLKRKAKVESLRKIEDKAYVDSQYNALLEIRKKYVNFTKGYPVVYAAKI